MTKKKQIEELTEKLNVASFRGYLARSAAELLAADDAETRAKGYKLLETLLYDERYQ